MLRTSEVKVLSTATAALFSALLGCGRLPQTSSAKLQDSSDAAPTALTYSTWCTAWSLSCPPAESGDDASKKLTAPRWKSLLKIASGIGQSSTSIDLTSSDLNDPVFTQASQALGFSATWTALQARLTAANFTSLHLASGAAAVNTSAPSTTSGPSGLVQHLGTQLTLNVTPDEQLGLTGLALSGTGTADARTTDTPHTLDVGEPGMFTWVGDNTTVSAVPGNFLLTETLGSALPPAGPKPAYKDLEALVAPLATWFSTRDGLSIDLAAAPLQTLAEEVPNFVTDPQAASAITAFLSKINSLRSTPTSRAQALFAGTTDGGVTCVFNEQAQLQLADRFAITAVRTLDDGNTSLTFEGIKVVLGTGVLTLPVDLKRIDLTPTSIIIQDLPIIGSYTVNIGDTPPDPSKLSFTCS